MKNKLHGLIRKREKEENKNSPNTRKRKKRIKRIVRVVVVFLIIGIAGRIVMSRMQKSISASSETSVTVQQVERRDISTVLSSSGSIEPLNIYNITTLVKGEIIAADFEEGDTIEKDAILYRLTTDEVQSSITAAQKTVTRAESAYDKVVDTYNKAVESYEEALDELDEKQEEYNETYEEYEEALEEYKSLNETADDSGIVMNVYIEQGSTVSKNSKIADIYDDTTMLLEVPFHASDIDSTWIGMPTTVLVDGSFMTLEGIVTDISEITSVLSGNQIAKNVTIEVKNPGGITVDSVALATVKDVECIESGSFSLGFEKTIVSEKAGVIDTVYIKKGSAISKGEILFSIAEESIEDAVATYKNAVTSAENSTSTTMKSVENAEDSIENAKDAIDSALETLEDAKTALEEEKASLLDCLITSPVTGVVVTKNILAGDIIGASNFTSTLAVIYDLSAVTFQMQIDELDIMTVKVGQSVRVTADALENEGIIGVVTNVSLESTTSGGVTQYPVTVRIDDVGELLPGMNVTGEIVLEGVEDVLCVPVDAIKRGNKVYVKDETVTEENGDVPAGFRSVDVETGLSDGDYIEVKSGLSDGDEIYLSRNASGTAQGLEFNMEGMFGSQNGNATRGSGGEFQGRPAGGNAQGGFQR